jgi:hypothetical protein
MSGGMDNGHDGPFGYSRGFTPDAQETIAALRTALLQREAALREIIRIDRDVNPGGPIYDAAGGQMDCMDPEEYTGPCAKIAIKALSSQVQGPGLPEVVGWLKAQPGCSWEATVKDIETACRSLLQKGG